MLYKSRYYAKKAADPGDVIVKVCAGGDLIGYMILTALEWRTWRKQK